MALRLQNHMAFIRVHLLFTDDVSELGRSNLHSAVKQITLTVFYIINIRTITSVSHYLLITAVHMEITAGIAKVQCNSCRHMNITSFIVASIQRQLLFCSGSTSLEACVRQTFL